MTTQTHGKDMNSEMDDDAQGVIKNAGAIIERFGGIRPMAGKMNVPVTTVQGWKKRDAIPMNRYQDIVNSAKTHHIELGDIMDKSAPANQNAQSGGADAPPAEPKVVHVHSSAPPFRHDEYKSHAELMAQIKAGNEKAVTASVWITTGLILLSMAGAGFLLWPTAKKVDQQDAKIAEIQQDVKDSNLRSSFFKNLMPEDMERKLDEMQNQARNLQSTMTQLSQNAEDLKTTMLSPDAGPLSERLAKLEDQVVALTGSEDAGNIIARLRTLEQTVNGQVQLSDAIKELQGIVDSMDGRVNTVEQDLQKAKEQQTALGQTLEGVSKDDMKAAAMLIAFSKLRDSLNRQQPFEEDLLVLQKLAGEDNPELQAALVRLAPQAEQGVLTSEGLSQEFKGLAGDIAFAAVKGEDLSVADKLKSRLNGMLKVEKDGQPVGGTAQQQTVARAQAMLDAGNVQGAIAELQTLDGEAGAKAAPFIDKAQQTLMTEQVQTMVYQEILSKLGSVAPGLKSQLQGVMPAPAVPGDAAAPETAVPSVDLNALKEDAKKLVPGMGGDMVKDDKSGFAITPRQNQFKGFSAGQ